MATTESLTSGLEAHVCGVVADSGGWIGFDRFMELALYTPGLGYYANSSPKFGMMPVGPHGRRSDFATAPEMTPFFGRAIARQLEQALQVSQTSELWEFGAGSGALAKQLLESIGDRVQAYTIVDLSGALQQRQREALGEHASKVRWASELPVTMRGVVIGNEVLDAMPVKLLARRAGLWRERGVCIDTSGAVPRLAWEDRPSDLRPPLEIAGSHDYLTEIHPVAEAFMATLADRLVQGAAFFLDYGFPEREYYHVQRHMGTLMCHRGHRSDADPLTEMGHKDITAHVDFTGLALAAQQAGGLGVLGYTTQARFLMNCGMLSLLDNATLQDRAMAQKLIMEHEMGELFKVIGFCKGVHWDAIGFAQGDRTHTL